MAGMTTGRAAKHVQEMEALMKQKLLAVGLVASMGLAPWAYTAEPIKYSAARFPSYTKAPKSVEEVMPFARSIARQTTGLQGDGFGILKDGESVALVLTATAEDMVVQAITRALEDSGIKDNLLYEYELVGVSRADAAGLRSARRQFLP